jgi:cell division protein FtsA
VVLVGGGAKLPGLTELTKEKLKLPVQIGRPQNFEGIVDQVDDPSFATVCGLIVSALGDGIKSESGRSFDLPAIGPAFNKAKKWIKGFMP